MSRIGKLPITIPEGVEIKISDTNRVTVKGKLGELEQLIDPAIKVKQEDGSVVLERATESKDHKSKHGLYRALINNMVKGVTEGFSTALELVGVGYKADLKGQLLDLSLGYSHHIFLELPPEVKMETVIERGKNPLIKMQSIETCKNCKKEDVAQEHYAPTSLTGPSLPAGTRRSTRSRLPWNAWPPWMCKITSAGVSSKA